MLTSGLVFHVTVVPSGKPVLVTLVSGFGTCPLSTVCAIPVGVYSSFEALRLPLPSLLPYYGLDR